MHLWIRVSKLSDVRFDGTEIIHKKDRACAPNDQDDHRGGQDSTTGSLHGLLLHDKRPTGGRHSFFAP
jgi:hypothetical protein